MDAMAPLKTGPTQRRWTAAMRDKAFDLIRHRKLMETAAELFLQVLNSGTVSTNMFCAACTISQLGCTGFLGRFCRNFTGRQ
jgi:hypothetical protein